MEEDPLASLFENPTDSLPDYPFFRPPTMPRGASQSPVRTPSPLSPFRRLVSPPQSPGSLGQPTLEEDAEFHTPPEHHALSHLSSSEDQNRLAGDEFVGETVPLGETDTQGNEGFLDAFGTVREIGGLVNNDVAKLDVINGNRRDLRGGIESAEDTGVASGSLESPKTVGDKSCLKVRLRIRGFEKGVTEDAEMQKDGPGNEDARSSGTKIVEIEEFRYVGDDDGKRRKLPPCSTEAGESLEKENSLEGKEKDLGEGSPWNMGKSLEKKNGLEGKEKDLREFGEKERRQEFLDVLDRVKPFLEDKDRGNEDEECVGERGV